MEEYYRRSADHKYKLHQMEQNRLKREAELRRKQRRKAQMIQKVVINLEHILSVVISLFNIIMVFVWVFSVSSLDSESYLPIIALIVSTIYLAAIAYIKGYMGNDNEA